MVLLFSSYTRKDGLRLASLFLKKTRSQLVFWDYRYAGLSEPRNSMCGSSSGNHLNPIIRNTIETVDRRPVKRGVQEGQYVESLGRTNCK